jgi:hypothetical protein
MATATQGMPQVSNSPPPSVLGDGSSGGSQVTDPAAASAAAAPSTSSSGFDLSSLGTGLADLGSSAFSSLSGMAPYLAAGGVGLYQANQAADQNQKLAGQLTALGQPLSTIGTNLAQQSLSGQLTPAQQDVVSTSQQQGQSMIDAAAPLASIANTGFANYQAGQLQPGQQQQIDAWTASAKQSLRQTLGNQGISDSSVLASQDAAIDSQATQLKANLMQQNLSVADQQFSQWATTTSQGQQTIAQGKQFAVTSLNQMLQDALGFSQAGMEPEMAAIQTAISSNSALSGQITQLMTGLMTAYAKSTYSAQGAGSSGGVLGSIGSALGKLGGGGGGGASSSSGNIASQYNNPAESAISFTSGFNDGTSGYNLNTDGTVDPSTFQTFFTDPSVGDVPNIDWGP